MAAAAKAAPRPELAVPWVGDLASRTACDTLLADAQSAVGRVTHFVHSASPPRREADHALAVSRETWAQFHARVTGALNHLAGSLGKGQTALVFSSGGVIAALSASLMELPPQALVAFNHVSINTGITKLVVGRGGTTLVSANEHAHLEEADAGLVTYR